MSNCENNRPELVYFGGHANMIDALNWSQKSNF